jgi:hypothetical protein
MLYNILYKIVGTLLYGMIYTMLTPTLKLSKQVAKLEAKLKCKIRPYNAYFKSKGLESFSEVPWVELHQFLIGVLGDYVISGTLYEYEKVLRHPSLVTSKLGAKFLSMSFPTRGWLQYGPGCATVSHLCTPPPP